MSLRTKLIAVFAALAFLPLVAVSPLVYRAGSSAVETLLRERAAHRSAHVARRVERIIQTQEARLLELAGAEPLRRHARDRQVAAAGAARPAGQPAARGAAGPAADEGAAALAGLFAAYAEKNGDYLQAVTLLDPAGRPLLRLNRSEGGRGFTPQTAHFVSGQARHDERARTMAEPKALRSPAGEEPYGAALRVTAPVFGPPAAEGAGAPAGAVVAEIRLGEVFKEAAEAGSEGSRAQSVVALDNATDTIVYHTNGGLSHQSASAMMPYFAGVAARMKAGESGFDFYDPPEGGTRLAAFGQAPGLNLSLAASEDYSGAVAPVRRAALLAGGAALLAGALGLVLVYFVAGRETRGIDLVARGASAIAAGNLDQRIDVSHSGETRELAENFNAMTERLRELIAREAESRQFQSFVRISAMISHDLKNAIAGLSMLVGNMERQFHREEFRADAIESLREATEKLKRTVARLSEPVKSLSGEYRVAARPTDLVPVIRRVLAANAEPSRPLYDIEARLPEQLVATVEPEGVENVLENLVINALEAMGAKGGRLTVEAGTLDGGLVFFSVSDTGVGMSEEFIRTRLFRPFSTTKSKGIGLGLFTCREVVEAHGGRLEVDSRPGAGTRFRVVLPSRLFNSGEWRAQPVKATAAAEVTRRPGPPE